MLDILNIYKYFLFQKDTKSTYSIYYTKNLYKKFYIKVVDLIKYNRRKNVKIHYSMELFLKLSCYINRGR